MTYLIKDLPKLEKPREKFKKFGREYVSDEDLIAIILRCGTKNTSVKDLAIKIKKEIPNLNRLTLDNLKKIDGVGEVKALTLLAAIELGKRSVTFTEEKIKLNNAKIIYDFFKPKIAYLEQEHLITVFLDNKNELISYKTIFIGTANMSISHPREILKEVVKSGAISFILVHNHPSGDPTPSRADYEFTKQMEQSSKIIGIPLLDHIIVGHKDYYSFFDNGEINENNFTK